uniref:Uncharacterized protein n=1 Tax=Solibacter usitatus (strain Ellin6076) TaxID=234267 RepID=Q021L3_SOLUE
MRRLLVSAVVFGGLICWTANAQHGGGGGGGRPAGGHTGVASGGMQAGRGGNWRDNNNGRRHGAFAGFGGWNYGVAGYGGDWNYGGWGYPYTYWDDFYAGGWQYQPAPAQLPLIQPGFPAPPPIPIQPVLQVYHWPDGPAPAHFSLVAKNGQVREPVAVWVQGSQVRYTLVGGYTGAFAPTSIDCAATDRLNTASNLRLSLPGCAPSK